MADFLTTSGSIAKIEEVITSANRELFLITPYVQLTDNYVRRLQDANDRGVDISLICRYKVLKVDERDLLDRLQRVQIYDDADLHAKCFISEAGMVLTSLNLYASSQKNNEMGVWLSADLDAGAYHAALQEARSIRKHATAMHPSRQTRAAAGVNGSSVRGPAERKQERSAGQTKRLSGKCIRCACRIPFNPERPYCEDCYKKWARWGNPFYEEVCCHSCGRPDGDSTLQRPQCLECYRENLVDAG